MEPVTHLMTGACLARAGFNRNAAYATLGMVIGAELPDIDTLWGVNGPVAAFQHHRGWTHTFLGIPVEAAVLVGGIWVWHRWRMRAGKVETGKKAAPLRWGRLFCFVVVALLSHILLDWTNNYGVRPFFPFNPRWYSGSIVFVFEPVLFVMLLGALVAPHLFGLIGSELGARKDRFRGRGWAVTALLGLVALWGWREVERLNAMRLVGEEDPGGQEMLRVDLSPYPVSPYKWHAVVETPGFYQLATVDTWRGQVTSEPEDTVYLPQTTVSTLVAKRSWLGEAYLDWSQFPLVQEVPKGQDDVDQNLRVVTFQDLRFMYDVPFLRSQGSRTPLEGSVTVQDGHTVVGMEMGGRAQR